MRTKLHQGSVYIPGVDTAQKRIHPGVGIVRTGMFWVAQRLYTNASGPFDGFTGGLGNDFVKPAFQVQPVLDNQIGFGQDLGVVGHRFVAMGVGSLGKQ